MVTWATLTAAPTSLNDLRSCAKHQAKLIYFLQPGTIIIIPTLSLRKLKLREVKKKKNRLKSPTSQLAARQEPKPEPCSPQHSGAGLVAYVSRNRDSIQLTEGKSGDKISRWRLRCYCQVLRSGVSSPF